VAKGSGRGGRGVGEGGRDGGGREKSALLADRKTEGLHQAFVGKENAKKKAMQRKKG